MNGVRCIQCDRETYLCELRNAYVCLKCGDEVSRQVIVEMRVSARAVQEMMLKMRMEKDKEN